MKVPVVTKSQPASSLPRSVETGRRHARSRDDSHRQAITLRRVQRVGDGDMAMRPREETRGQQEGQNQMLTTLRVSERNGRSGAEEFSRDAAFSAVDVPAVAADIDEAAQVRTVPGEHSSRLHGLTHGLDSAIAAAQLLQSLEERLHCRRGCRVVQTRIDRDRDRATELSRVLLCE